MTKSWQSHFDTIAKLAGVSLGFAIPISNALTNVSVIILLLAWCCSGIKQKIQRIANSKVTWAIVCLLLVYLLGATYSIAELAEIKFMLHKMSRLLLIPILMSLFIDAKWRRYAIYSFLCAIVISLLIIIIKCSFSLAYGSDWLKEMYVVKLAHFFSDSKVAFKDRIFTSLFFSYATFVLLHFAREKSGFKPDTYSFTTRSLRREKIFIYSLALLNFIYLFTYCDGRSGHAIFLLLLEIFFFQQKFGWKKIFTYNVFLCVCICTMWNFSVDIKDRYTLTGREARAYATHEFLGAEIAIDSAGAIDSIEQQKLESLHNQSTGLRLTFLINNLKIAKTSPLLGYGTGSFRQIYNKIYPLYDDLGVQLQVKNPHNQYLLTLVELGIFGLFALMAIFMAMLYESIFLPNLERFLFQGLIAAIVVGCIINSWLMDFPSMHFFAYFAGLFLACLPTNSHMLSSTNRRPQAY